MKHIPVAQPKYTPSPKLKALTIKANKMKRRMGLKGTAQAGDLINRAKTLKKKVAIMGLI